MLLELHVKSLALIGGADMEFGEGFNILIDETGAGKPTVIGSVTMVLGDKAPKDNICSGTDYAYIKLMFSVIEEEKRKVLRELEVEPTGNGLVIIFGKLTPGRSISRTNDKTMTVTRPGQVVGLLLDMYRQHEHQSLLYEFKHPKTLGAYVKAAIQPVKQTTADRYRTYHFLEEEPRGFDLGAESRIREADFLRFEIKETEALNLKKGEEEEFTSIYRRYSHSRRIAGYLGVACEAVEGKWLSRALKETEWTAGYDETPGGIRDQLYDANSVLRDAGREMSAYLDSMEMNEGIFRKTEERLDLIHNLQAKYGTTVEAIRQKLEQEKKRLEELEDYGARRKCIEQGLEEYRNGLKKPCAQLTGIHKKMPGPSVRKIRQGLVDLNFLNVEFDVEFEKPDHFAPSGWDGAQFLTSTGPGQPMRPPEDMALGGELSRIMLATKTMLADSDNIPALILDEIGTGISGRTAQKASEKLMLMARSHRIICITRLPQIVAMADSHFEIARSASQGRAITTTRPLDRKASVEELAGLLGGVRITEAVLKDAGEMKELADGTK